MRSQVNPSKVAAGLAIAVILAALYLEVGQIVIGPDASPYLQIIWPLRLAAKAIYLIFSAIFWALAISAFVVTAVIAFGAFGAVASNIGGGQNG